VLNVSVLFEARDCAGRAHAHHRRNAGDAIEKSRSCVEHPVAGGRKGFNGHAGPAYGQETPLYLFRPHKHPPGESASSVSVSVFVSGTSDVAPSGMPIFNSDPITGAP
jgi:hypothetical protein